MHFLDEIEPQLERKLAVYLREHQAGHGGWPLYHGGALDLSCTVKAYYALKLAGDDPQAPHMRRAREAILARGGAAHVNVFTRIALALFGQVPWRAVPYIPVEIMLLPKWFPFHLDKVSYWSRTVMVPLFVLCTLKPLARNPRHVDVRELFTKPPEEERHYFQLPRTGRLLARIFFGIDRVARRIDPLIPAAMRKAALRRAEAWVLERLNGEDGLGAIFPAMVNALEMMVLFGYRADDPRRVTAKRAIEKLLVIRADRAYCQPCVSPVWDTALAALAMQEAGDDQATRAAVRALDWLRAAAGAGGCRGLARAPPAACRPAAGPSSTAMRTIRISTTPPWSPGPCIRRGYRSATPTASSARSTGWSACRARTAASPPSMPTTPTTTSTTFPSPITARCSIRRPAT